jgi:hypothetical protein|tara:strand:- start:445 stop:678 length:234 start_codon:yes stop_codon:yes gene_type:complete
MPLPAAALLAALGTAVRVGGRLSLAHAGVKLFKGPAKKITKSRKRTYLMTKGKSTTGYMKQNNFKKQYNIIGKKYGR